MYTEVRITLTSRPVNTDVESAVPHLI